MIGRGAVMKMSCHIQHCTVTYRGNITKWQCFGVSMHIYNIPGAVERHSGGYSYNMNETTLPIFQCILVEDKQVNMQI